MSEPHVWHVPDVRGDRRVWHPWIRVSRVIQDVLGTRWGAGTWPLAKQVLQDAMKERSKVRRAGWFN